MRSGTDPVLTPMITSGVWSNAFTRVAPLLYNASGDSDLQAVRKRTVLTIISFAKGKKKALLLALKLAPISYFSLRYWCGRGEQ